MYTLESDPNNLNRPTRTRTRTRTRTQTQTQTQLRSYHSPNRRTLSLNLCNPESISSVLTLTLTLTLFQPSPTSRCRPSSRLRPSSCRRPSTPHPSPSSRSPTPSRATFDPVPPHHHGTTPPPHDHLPADHSTHPPFRPPPLPLHLLPTSTTFYPQTLPRRSSLHAFLHCPFHLSSDLDSSLILVVVFLPLMDSSAIQSGAPVALQDLQPSSPLFKHGASLRLTGRLQSYCAETAIAVIADGSTSFKIDTQHLRGISFRLGSIFQFIGELEIHPGNVFLQARIGRNVDGLDLNLYSQTLKLLQQFMSTRK